MLTRKLRRLKTKSEKKAGHSFLHQGLFSYNSFKKMPAKSKKQQMAMGAALAAKRGELPYSRLYGASRQMVKSMTLKQLTEFAKTKRKNLPLKRSVKKYSRS